MKIDLPGVCEEPQVTVAPWVVLEVQCVVAEIPPPYRFVVGYDHARACGRVSTLIVEQDFDKRRVRTKSGRVYVLEGRPAIDLDAWYVWLENAGSVQCKDVSGEFWPGYEPGSAQVVETFKDQMTADLEKQGYRVSRWLEDEGN